MFKTFSLLSCRTIRKPFSLIQKYLTTMHSNIVTKEFGKFKVAVLPALDDNFMYLLIDNDTKKAAIVDPVNPDVVLEAVSKENVNLTTILTTHHHWDHAGGNRQLKDAEPKDKPFTVFGGDERIECLTVMIDKHGVDHQLGSLNIKCLRTPCHTTGHVCYYVSAGEEGVVFTGDTLFLGGCGRFFEGDATQMYNALIKILSQLPDSTSVFCGHEYAIQNLNFGLHVEPSNQDIVSQLELIKSKRELKEPSVPSTIGLEKLINPFMRVEKESVQEVTKTVGDPIETMKVLREMKNNF